MFFVVLVWFSVKNFCLKGLLFCLSVGKNNILNIFIFYINCVVFKYFFIVIFKCYYFINFIKYYLVIFFILIFSGFNSFFLNCYVCIIGIYIIKVRYIFSFFFGV